MMGIAEQSHRDGYVIVKGLLDAEPVAQVLQHARETMARASPTIPPNRSTGALCGRRTRSTIGLSVS